MKTLALLPLCSVLLGCASPALAVQEPPEPRADSSALVAPEDGFTPIRRWGEPLDVAEAVATLAEGRLPFTVGQVITVDGGLTFRTL